MKYFFIFCVLFFGLQQSIIERRLVEGSAAKKKTWMVYLTDNKNFCGGVLYTKSLVITAAHCNEAESPRGWKAYINVQKNLPHPKASSSYGIIKIINHQGYDPYELDYDISVWWINGNSNKFMNVKLDDGSELLKDSLEVNVLGWGNNKRISNYETVNGFYEPNYPGFLQLASIPLVSNERCFLKYGLKFKSSIMFCMGRGRSGPGASFGDSGGPVYRKIGAEIVLIGLISFALASGYQDFYDVNTKISESSISDFINHYVPLFKPVNSRDKESINSIPIFYYEHSPVLNLISSKDDLKNHLYKIG